MGIMKRLFICIVCLLALCASLEARIKVSNNSGDGFPIATGGVAAQVYVSPQDGRTVKKAADLFADDGLERANDIRERGRAESGAEYVVGVLEIRSPVPHGFVYGIFQGAATAGDRHHLGTIHFHGGHVGLLTSDVHFTHVHHAFKAKLGASGSSGEAVLAGARFRNDAGLAHLLCKEALADSVVDLVSAGVGKAFQLDVNLL